MANKIYEIIKDNIKSIIFIIIFIVVINLKLPFSVYAPGGTIDISKRLNKNTTSNINMTYVSFIEGKIPVLLLSFLMPNWDIVKDNDIKYDNETLKDSITRDKIYLYESISNAKSVAYKYLNKDLEIKETKYYATYISEEADTDIKIGDEIISIDNHPFDQSLVDTYFSNKIIGEEVLIKVKNNDKEYTRKAKLIEANNKLLIGISYAKVNEYKDSIVYNYKSSESGPSGGAMLTLAIINELSDTKILKDTKICGTGTIDENGNIGEIGGVKYKLLGAVKNKCEVFITPKDNYQEAQEVKEKNKLNIKLYSADNIDDLISNLSS